MIRTLSVASLVALTHAASQAGTTQTETYLADFSGSDGNVYGGSNYVTSYNTLQLISDYGGLANRGTWTTGGLSRPNATGPISAFSASFKFAMNHNNDGTPRSDGFSFLFGDLSDMSGDNYLGGEAGINRFEDLNAGLAVGFDTYDNVAGDNTDTGIRALWGTDQRAYDSRPESFLDQVIYGSYASANTAASMATAYVSWAAGGDLVVSIAFPTLPPVEYLRSSAFSDIDVTDAFSFGLTARIGAATWDVQIDDFNVAYTYAVPGPAGIAALAGLAAVRRRRR